MVNETHEEYKSRIEKKIEEHKKRGEIVPSLDMIKTPEQIEKIKEACRVNSAVLDYVAENIKIGMSTQDIDDLVSSYTKSMGAKSAQLHFEGYPKSVCTSINEEVCHGIPSRLKKLKDGDIINVDVSTIVDGYFGDASRMFELGNVSEDKRKLVQVTRECLELGIKASQAWAHVGDIGAAISEHARKNGFSVVTQLGGHGIGLEFHEDPFISHVGKKGTGMLLVPGMIFTIEPMINMGKSDVVIDRYNGWTIYTKDNKPSAQIEHQILITEDGPQILSY